MYVFSLAPNVLYKIIDNNKNAYVITDVLQSPNVYDSKLDYTIDGGSKHS